MKKIMKSILSVLVVMFMWISFSLGDDLRWDTDDADFPYMNIESYSEDSAWKSDLPNVVDIKSENSIITRLLDYFELDIVKSEEHKFLNYVKAILNVALGVLSLVALIMTIYTFYMMFFTENEAWIKKAKQSLIGIFIALAIIWLSWLIVRFIFLWYEEQWKKWSEAWNITMINYELNDDIYLTV